jgi:hypothetical protein
VDVSLRTQQVDFLERLSQEADIPLDFRGPLLHGTDPTISETLSRVIAFAQERIQLRHNRPTRKVRKHLTIPCEHLDYVNRLTAVWGVPRSEVVRRLIDKAMAEGFRL